MRQRQTRQGIISHSLDGSGVQQKTELSCAPRDGCGSGWQLTVISEISLLTHCLRINSEYLLEDQAMQQDDVEPAQGGGNCVESAFQIVIAAQAEKG